MQQTSTQQSLEIDMAEIAASNTVGLKTLMENIQLYRYNPSEIQRAVLDHLENITSGEIDIVDPTNPFVFLLESSAVNTAAAMIESEMGLRRLYPSLAQTQEHLYLHMSDKDYVGRFATPAETTFTFMIQLNSLLGSMVRDSAEFCDKVTIPRNTEFSIEDWIFSLEYPIHIKKFDNGVVQVVYDTTQTSPLRALTTNIIDTKVRRDADQIDWLVFDIEVSQFKLNSTQYPVQASTVFKEVLDFTGNYYFCRVFYRNDAGSTTWFEMRTTHTDQVYDINYPTACLEVIDNAVSVYIPSVYINSGQITGTVRIDVYTTAGALTVNLSNYALTSFGTNLLSIDDENDVNDYTNAMLDVTFIAYSDKVVSGGTKPVSFTILREQVNNNAVGPRLLPITNAQAEANADMLGFGIVKNVDNVTNRIFLATKNLPKPTNARLLTAANISIETFITTIDGLADVEGVANNYNRYTLTSSLVYVYENGKIAIYPKEQLQTLLGQTPISRAESINAINYLYSPFYYVLDNTASEFELRPYHLDQPEVTGLSFVSQNPSAQLPVNTATQAIEKTPTGYRLTIVTKSGNFYKQLADNFVQVQLAFIPVGEISYAYLNGTLVGMTADDERIYQFDMVTNHDIDSNHLLYFTNFAMFADENVRTPAALTTEFSLFYTTTSITNDFVPSAVDSMIGTFMLPNNAVAVTHETVGIQLGVSLKNLWSRSRSVASGIDYQTYETDVPMRYETDVYDTDPVTGSIFVVLPNGTLSYNLLHHKDDVVLNAQDEIVYQHRKGDVILDDAGKPVALSTQNIARHCDMLFVDGIYYFSTDGAYSEYRKELPQVVSTWITQDLAKIDKALLEQTRIYYYPKRSIGLVKVMVSTDSVTFIESQQAFNVVLYVRSNVYRDNRLREELKRVTTNLISTAIQTKVVSISEITKQLTELYDESVVSVKLSGLGGADYETLTVVNDSDQLCLRKKLMAQEDGTLIVVEDINFTFVNYDPVG